MKKQLSMILLLLLTAITSIHCGAARGTTFQENGEVEASTNSLVSAQKLDLFLDQIHFDGVFWSAFEIHIMDETESQLLACTGGDGFSDAIITFAQLKNQFVIDDGIKLEADTPIVVRFIEKKSAPRCPNGYVGTVDSKSADRVLGKQSMTYRELNTKLIEFPKVATVGFTKGDQASWPVVTKDPVSDGVLSVDQIKIRSGINYGEWSQPEWAVALYQEGYDIPVACTDISEVDKLGILYATMDYDFFDADNREVRLTDFDLSANYRAKLLEFDWGNCQDLLDEEKSFDTQVSFFGATRLMLLTELLDDVQSLNGFGDYIRLTAR